MTAMRRTAMATGMLVLAGCAGEPAAPSEGGAFPDAAMAAVTSHQGALSLEVRTAPSQPPQRGMNNVEYTVVDQSGVRVDGLSLSVLPWMPDMGHGAPTDPHVEAEGDGRYVVRDVNLFMPGRWTLETTIEGAVEDSATVTFHVP